MTFIPKAYRCEGGLDLVTPALEMPAGRVIACQNYEPVLEGYGRFDGYERFDGQAQPHLASYWVLNFDQGTAAISEGDTVTDATSGATGVALIDAVVSSGSYVGSDAAGYLILTEVSGTFGDDNNLQVSAVTKSVADGTATEKGASNDTDHDNWLQDAIETARTAISAVTGSGSILGVWRYNGVSYAFRNNAGGTAAVMFKSTSSGWSSVDLGSQIDFSSGTAEFTEGGTLTGGVSGATATIERVIKTSGSWTDGDAAGYLILSGVSGTFQGETITDGSGGSATADGADAAITLAASGRYEFRNFNFLGSADSERMYGVDGANKGFEFDGTVFVPIRTGMTTDTPTHLALHKNQLFYSFANGSIQHSGIGDPYTWSVISGASEFGFGRDVTAFMEDVAGALIVYGLNKIAVLYGNDATDWVLEGWSDEAGAVEWSVQKIGNKPYHMDHIGIADLATAKAYADFKANKMSVLIEPLFRAKRKNGVTLRASVRVRGKNQYRLLWSDKTVTFCGFSKKNPEFMLGLLDDQMACGCSVEDSDGTEWVLLGGDDGFVYRSDVGTSFDGGEMEYFLRYAWNHFGSPRVEKRWKGASLEIESGPSLDLNAAADFAYGSTYTTSDLAHAFSIQGGGGFWDEANWNEFYWSAQAEGEAFADIRGKGKNIGLAINGAATYDNPHILHSYTLWARELGITRTRT